MGSRWVMMTILGPLALPTGTTRLTWNGIRRVLGEEVHSRGVGLLLWIHPVVGLLLGIHPGGACHPVVGIVRVVGLLLWIHPGGACHPRIVRVVGLLLWIHPGGARHPVIGRFVRKISPRERRRLSQQPRSRERRFRIGRRLKVISRRLPR